MIQQASAALPLAERCINGSANWPTIHSFPTEDTQSLRAPILHHQLIPTTTALPCTGTIRIRLSFVAASSAPSSSIDFSLQLLQAPSHRQLAWFLQARRRCFAPLFSFPPLAPLNNHPERKNCSPMCDRVFCSSCLLHACWHLSKHS